MLAFDTDVIETSSPIGAGGASGSSGFPSGVNSNKFNPMSTAPWPSAMAWCSFMMIAARPSGSPSTKTASHNGRAWSKSVRLIRRASASTSPQPLPGIN